MNILPKKSWHVLNKDNIQRVRRDEARARAEEEEKASRAALAEREARLGAMRKRARERDGLGEEEGGRGGGGGERKKTKGEEDVSVTDTSGHINFFTDIQKGVGLQVGNVERDKEMKQEQEKMEKRIGLLNYLVDKDKSDTPWYVKGSQSISSSAAAVVTEEIEVRRKSAKAQHRKELQDPLLQMKGYLETKKKKEKEEATPSGAIYGTTGSLRQLDRQSSSNSDSRRGRTSSGDDHRHHHKHKKSEHKKSKKKKKEKDDKKHKKKEKKEDELERLRRERRKREEGEKVRSEALIRGLQGGASDTQAVEPPSARYNSQFNPHLARQH